MANTNAGRTFWISQNPVNADLTAAQFAALAWIQVKGVGQVGETGPKTNLLNYPTWDTIVEQKAKGLTDAGSPTIDVARIPGDPGQVALRAAALLNVNYGFRTLYNDAPGVLTSVVTVTVAAPGVVTWTAHGFLGGEAIQFTTTGVLPTGLALATTYYVLPAGITANTFTVSATPGGAAITTTGAGSGVNTGVSVPFPSTTYNRGLVVGPTHPNGTNESFDLEVFTLGLQMLEIMIYADD